VATAARLFAECSYDSTSTSELTAAAARRRLALPLDRGQIRVIGDWEAIRRRQRMAKDHGSSVKNDKQYEGLRKKGMSKERAAKIANSSGSSKRGGKNSS
jgi:hypothetical protein